MSTIKSRIEKLEQQDKPAILLDENGMSMQDRIAREILGDSANEHYDFPPECKSVRDKILFIMGIS